MKRGPHKQVWAKVNAPVDEGIAELVGALSEFPKLQTIESCQGDAGETHLDREGAPAVVFFHYGQHDHAHPYRDIADFVLGHLGPGLIRELGDLVGVSLRVTEYGVRADLVVRHGVLPRAVKILKRLRRGFEDQPP